LALAICGRDHTETSSADRRRGVSEGARANEVGDVGGPAGRQTLADGRSCCGTLGGRPRAPVEWAEPRAPPAGQPVSAWQHEYPPATGLPEPFVGFDLGRPVLAGAATRWSRLMVRAPGASVRACQSGPGRAALSASPAGRRVDANGLRCLIKTAGSSTTETKSTTATTTADGRVRAAIRPAVSAIGRRRWIANNLIDLISRSAGSRASSLDYYRDRGRWTAPPQSWAKQCERPTSVIGVRLAGRWWWRNESV
jgi:hypothetical protein